MSVRNVVDQVVFQINPNVRFEESFPPKMLCVYNNDQRIYQRLLEMWNKILVAMNRLRKMRMNPLIRQSYRMVVYKSAMENLCKQFSESFEDIKMKFYAGTIGTNRGSGGSGRLLHRLVLIRLSPAPDNCRGQSILAEIPQPEIEVEATPYNNNSNSNGYNTHQEHESITVTAIDVLESRVYPLSAPSMESSYTASPSTLRYCNTDEMETVQLAVAHPVEIITNPPTNGSQNQALQRMEQLESIKRYLTNEEFNRKRLEIISSL